MNELMRKLLFLPEQASTVAQHIDWLHFFVISITMIGATGVAAFTLYFIVRYRERPDRPAEPVRGPESRRAMSLSFELCGFGGLLSLFVLWWVIGFAQYVRIAEPPPDSMTIYVTAKQWIWSFAYPNGTGSNGVLYVPAGRPVKLVMTSRDVIHSFYVPTFRLKRDVVPGQATMMWFEVKHPGHYPVYCAEYCGTGHSTMRAEVVALAPADYEQQLQGLERLTPTTADSHQATLAAIGQRIAATAGCLRCHTPDGTPHIGPTWAGLYGSTVPLEGGQHIIADEAYLTRSMMDPGDQIHLGFKPVMPSYQGVIASSEVAALVEYIRSLRDVNPSDGQQPLPAEVPGNVPLVNPPESEIRGATR